MILFISFNSILFSQAPSPSVYTSKVEDDQAVYFTMDNFDIRNDGSMDISEELQKAIRKVNEKTGFGILFIPEGTYQITKTIMIPKGVRVIGYGKTRPVFVLKKTLPDFRKVNRNTCSGLRIILDRKNGNLQMPIRELFTVQSPMLILEFEDGNPAAIGIRSHFAQHCFISQVDFFIGKGRSGIEEIGNEIENCKFYGGDYGIITTKPSPSWPFAMLDTYFEGQRKGAIRTQEGGLTIVGMVAKNVPCVVEINRGFAEELWIENAQFISVSGPAIVVGDEKNARTFINLRQIDCSKVPVLVSFPDGKEIKAASEKIYRISDFCHGNQIHDLGFNPEINTTYNVEALKSLPAKVKSEIPQLPATQTWVNLKSLGAKGDETTDDTQVLQDAIDKYQTIYLPTGRYRITSTLKLKPNTVLVGLNPIAAQIMIKDNTEAFSGHGTPVPLIETPQGGTNMMCGIGIDAGGINPRAVGVKWMSDENSYMNDVRFIGGHGTLNADGSSVPAYNNNRTADGNPARKWDSQYWSLWVTNGGGGTFKDIWTPSPYAAAGLYVSNTSTPGRIYAMSSEHHVRNELKFKNVSNWKMYAIQMEEESGESWNCLPVEIENSENMLFSNLYLYRVIRIVSPFPYGVRIWNSRNIEFRGVHTYSPTKFTFDNTIYVADHNFEIRSREIAKVIISGAEPVLSNSGSDGKNMDLPVEKVAGGFEFIDGTVAD
ncbi:MAG: gluconolaconase, partial [Bacteroidales bacterium]|nr:gluconolaconase [Bacteroidales bacterium]